jgi:hypothetical protein
MAWPGGERAWVGETCVYGHPEPCGKPADFICTSRRFHEEMPGCLDHARFLHADFSYPVKLIRQEEAPNRGV